MFVFGSVEMNLPAVQETQFLFLGQEDSLEKEMAIHSSIPAWKFHGQRKLAGYSPWGLKESDMTEHGPVFHHPHEESSVGLTKGWGQGKTEADTLCLLCADKEENGHQDLNWRKTALSIMSIIKGGFNSSQEDELAQ